MPYQSNEKYLKKYRQALRNNPSMAEDLLWGYIRKSRLGIKFRRQHSIGNYILDFYAPTIMLNVEVDGEQHDGTIEQDSLRDKYLESFDIATIRISSLECINNMEGVLEEIRSVSKGQLNHPFVPSLGRRGDMNR